jgi:hypothetical protein
MSIYRDITIAPLAGSANGLTFKIGHTEYSADHLAEARALIDEILDNEVVEHRGVLAYPDHDGMLVVGVGSETWRIQSSDRRALVRGVQALIDAELARLG